MTDSYGSIPRDPNATASSGGGTNTAVSSNKTLYFALAAILVAGVVFFSGGQPGDIAPADPLPPPIEAEHWPPIIHKNDAAFQMYPTNYPTTTTAMAAMGFAKTADPCDPLLGEAWTYQGERASKYSSVFYFTPAVGDTPGVLSGVGADYYGHVDEKLIQTGVFFSEEKIGTDGSYRSIAAALRNGEVENLCDTETPVSPGNPPYIMVSPGKANIPIPPTEDVAALEQGGFQAGSCIRSMGYHWSQFLEPQELPYKAGDLMPVTPMYSSTDGTINGIFFVATDRKQTWPEGCSPVDPSQCAPTKVNMWDCSPGLTEETKGFFYMCSNFCGECSWTGSADGMFTTMHFFFKEVSNGFPDQELCGNKTTGQLPLTCER